MRLKEKKDFYFLFFMKENYAPWEVKIDDFFKLNSEDERLKFLVKLAVLAPSSHNAQPWLFRVLPGKIEILANKSRHLSASDKEGRMINMGLGCALENLILSADYYGYRTSVEYPDDGDVAVRIAFEKMPDAGKDKKHLIFEMSKRHMNRSWYKDEVPPPEFLEKAMGFAREGVRIDFVSDPNKKEKIIQALLAGIRDAFSDTDFRHEVSRHVISNFSGRKMGIPASNEGFSAGASLIVSKILWFFDVGASTAEKNKKRLEHTPVFGIISAERENRETWIRVGQIYERITLLANRAGLSTAIMAAATEIGEHYKKVQEALGTDWRPQIFFRLGYATAPAPPSPRFSAEEVIIK